MTSNFHITSIPLSLHQRNQLSKGYGIILKYDDMSSQTATHYRLALTLVQRRRLLKHIEAHKNYLLRLSPEQRVITGSLMGSHTHHEGSVESGGGIMGDVGDAVGDVVRGGLSHIRSGLVTPAENLAKAYLKAQTANLSKSVLDTAIRVASQKLTGGGVEGNGLYLPQGRGLYLA